MDDIRYIKRQDLDVLKWDACIDNATNGLIYAYSFYLDAMCDNWDALVMGDYEAVMPLPWRKKWGIKYVYQPFLVAQLGLFGTTLTKEKLDAFIHAVPMKFRYIDYMLNHKNVFMKNMPDIYTRKNFVIDLDKTYDNLYKNFRQNIKRNIKKSVLNDCQIIKDFNIEPTIKLVKQQGVIKATEKDFNRFGNLFKYLESSKKAINYTVITASGEVLSSAAFLFSHDRAYYILAGNHPNSKTVGASHALINAFIKDHSDQKLKLDFEGSSISSLAFYYNSFGATEEDYAALKINRLPLLLRWLKK